MLIERYLALQRPFWAKRTLTLQNVGIEHAVCVVPTFVFLTYELVQTPGTLFEKRCMISPTLGVFGLFIGVIAQQIQYTVHAVLDAVFDVLTLAKVSTIRKRSTHL